MVNVNSPTLKLTVNNKNPELGDTLRITIHASDPTLSTGELNFWDGTLIKFINLSSEFDTTIYHLYTWAGKHTITATFGNGNSYTFSSVSINIKYYYYSSSFKVGTIWRFSYSFKDQEPASPYGTDIVQNGIHEWKITSYTVDNRQDTIFTVLETKQDTVTNWQVYGLDSTGVLNDSTEFKIIVAPDSIRYNWPLYAGPKTISVPNHFYASSYPVLISTGQDYTVSKYNDNGPIYYSDYHSGSHGYLYDEEFRLLEFIK